MEPFQQIGVIAEVEFDAGEIGACLDVDGPDEGIGVGNVERAFGPDRFGRRGG